MRRSVLIFVSGLFFALSAFSPAMNPGISDDEKAGLLRMREEEKLAYDVYTAMYEKWNHHVFDNIRQSEMYHGDLVKGLLTTFTLDDPYIAESGKYRDKTLQKLYNDLLTKGNKSLVDAFEVGAIIEDMDIADLDKLMANTKNSAIKEVYETLHLGSRNHMRAFVRNLDKNNKNYSPAYISKKRFNDIIEGDHESCADNTFKNGKGNKGNNGKNHHNRKSCEVKQGNKSCAAAGRNKNCTHEVSSCGSAKNQRGCCR